MNSFSEIFLDQMEEQGFAIIDGFIADDRALEIASILDDLRENQQFKKAGIGRVEDYQIDKAQRGDYILWIDPENPEGAVAEAIEGFHTLKQVLNRSLYLGIDHFECHYVHYPVGTHYLKHVDRHKSGSPRVVSFVLYLNENWKEEDGGELRIYKRDGSTADILPLLGRMVVFLSEMEHEVRTTHRIRNSITGWMRQREF
ncbi:MAG: 2OG-Fe(II) oxygenase [Flavobacteriales bacterium]